MISFTYWWMEGKYTIGYNVPSYEYLYNSGDKFILNMRLIDQIFDDMIIDEIVVKIILPEGRHKLNFDLPYEVKQLSASLHYTYLDTEGRPVISVTEKNLVENSYYNHNIVTDVEIEINICEVIVLLSYVISDLRESYLYLSTRLQESR